MKRKTYSKEVWAILIIQFLKGIEFIGVVLVPFFTDWGGISQFQIQLLQSWFTLSIFLAEIPTGLVGDIKGLKYSVVMGQAIWILGVLVYASTPNIYVFALGELILAIGAAFTSGAEEALLYETMKDSKETESFNKVMALNGNLKLAGMILSSAVAGFLIPVMSLNHVFMLGAVPRIFALVLTILLVKEPKVSKSKELIPNYKQIFKQAISGLRSNGELKRIAIFTTIAYGVSYFVLWFNQPLLKGLGVTNEKLGVYRIVLILSEIFFVSIIVWMIDKFKKKRNLINIILVLLVAGGFLVSAFWKDIVGVLIFIVISGGIGLKFRDIFSKTLNDRIDSKQRATSLSAISMVSKLFLAVANVIFGFLSDISLHMTLGILGLILLIGGLIFVPKEN
jgi:MFS family permease